MSTTSYANAPTDELSTRGDDCLCKGYSESAMSTTGYANAPTA
ncbi:hypothetical protein [uncultured Nostoc sp.]